MILPVMFYNWDNTTGESILVTPFLLDWSKPTETTRYQCFLPFFFRRLWEGNEQILFLPIYYRHHIKDASTGDIRDTTIMMPLFSSSTRLAADGTVSFERFMLFFPLFHRSRSLDEGMLAYDVLWPCLHYSQSPSGFNLRVLPLVWAFEDATVKGWQLAWARVIFPLFYRFETGDGLKLTIFFPFWFKLEGRTIGTAFSPSFLLPICGAVF